MKVNLSLDPVFIKYLEAQYRPSTVHVYTGILKRFVEGMDGRELTVENVMRYLQSVSDGERSITSYAIRMFLRYKGYGDLANMVPVSHGTFTRKKMPLWIPEPVVKYIVDTSKQRYPRFAAMVAVSYDLALRRNELYMLNRVPMVDHPYINPDNGRAVIYRMKTRQYPWQQLSLSDWSLKLLRNYLRTRRDDDDALFTSEDGGRLSYNGIDTYFRRRMSTDYGFSPNSVSIKMLRHSKLTWMAVQGYSLIDIAKYAGHTTPNPTLIYIHAASQFRSDPIATLESLKGTKIYNDAVRVVEDYVKSAKGDRI